MSLMFSQNRFAVSTPLYEIYQSLPSIEYSIIFYLSFNSPSQCRPQWEAAALVLKLCKDRDHQCHLQECQLKWLFVVSAVVVSSRLLFLTCIIHSIGPSSRLLSTLRVACPLCPLIKKKKLLGEGGKETVGRFTHMQWRFLLCLVSYGFYFPTPQLANIDAEEKRAMAELEMKINLKRKQLVKVWLDFLILGLFLGFQVMWCGIFLCGFFALLFFACFSLPWRFYKYIVCTIQLFNLLETNTRWTSFCASASDPRKHKVNTLFLPH
mgnify:CR=1 FL=1